MNNKVKEFFNITDKEYKFEMYDLTTLITVLNVAFIIMRFWWAPILGIANCVVFIILNIINKVHINSYITQIALIILNIYFLTL